jgi:hypothetical protein
MIFTHLINKLSLPWFMRLFSGLSPWWPRFAPCSAHMGFVMDTVAPRQVFLRILPFSLVGIIPPWLSILICHLGESSRPAGGRSSETSSRPIDMSNNNNNDQEILRRLNSKLGLRVRKSPSLDSNLIRRNLLYTLPPYVFKIWFNIFL